MSTYINWFLHLVLQGVRWGDVGYPEVSGRESTLWIGNVGAHTPCHMDSYGYNLVAQLYGRYSFLGGGQRTFWSLPIH